jgi:hypothetical protein
MLEVIERLANEPAAMKCALCGAVGIAGALAQAKPLAP